MHFVSFHVLPVPSLLGILPRVWEPQSTQRLLHFSPAGMSRSRMGGQRSGLRMMWPQGSPAGVGSCTWCCAETESISCCLLSPSLLHLTEAECSRKPGPTTTKMNPYDVRLISLFRVEQHYKSEMVPGSSSQEKFQTRYTATALKCQGEGQVLWSSR